jgi:hypothetical protein
MEKQTLKTKLIGQLCNARLEGMYEGVDFSQLGMKKVVLAGTFRHCKFKRAETDQKKYPRLDNVWDAAKEKTYCDVDEDEDDIED